MSLAICICCHSPSASRDSCQPCHGLTLLELDLRDVECLDQDDCHVCCRACLNQTKLLSLPAAHGRFLTSTDISARLVLLDSEDSTVSNQLLMWECNTRPAAFSQVYLDFYASQFEAGDVPINLNEWHMSNVDARFWLREISQVVRYRMRSPSSPNRERTYVTERFSSP